MRGKLFLKQRHRQRIRDFIREIDEVFLNKYGPPQKYNSRFVRDVKSDWLINGMEGYISKRFIGDKDDSWSYLVEAAQDAEWLADLRYKENHRVGKGKGLFDYYDVEDFRVQNGWLIIYTDGACIRNGMPDAQAGIGVWFGPYSNENISEPLDPGETQTNNTAEIKAVIKAVEIAKDNGFDRIEIRTDCKFVIDSMTNWIYKWLVNGWVNSNGAPLKHKDNFRRLLGKLEDMDVKWVHVRAHGDDEDNIMADTLARQGAARNEYY